MHDTALCWGIPNITQLTRAVIGKSMYLTIQKNEAPDVIHGMLLKFHPAGIIKQPQNISMELRSWRKWPQQIARVLNQLHQRGLVHMDIKPPNIVLDSEGNAVLIDLGGHEVTHEWFAPELRDVEDIVGCPFKAKVLGELWTLGRLFADLVEYYTDGDLPLSCLAKQLMHDDPTLRPSLHDVIQQLDAEELMPVEAEH
jgi:hypothetical protein